MFLHIQHYLREFWWPPYEFERRSEESQEHRARFSRLPSNEKLELNDMTQKKGQDVSIFSPRQITNLTQRKIIIKHSINLSFLKHETLQISLLMYINLFNKCIGHPKK